MSLPVRAAPTGRTRLLERRSLIAALAVGAVGALARFLLLRSAGGLSGSGLYDDGVYFSAAESLVHGRLPYADFLLLHPPGLLLALSPFAAAARAIGDASAFELARIAFVLLGGVNAGLVVVVLRRFGGTAMVTGGVFYALFVRSMQSEQTVALETLGSGFVLLALVLHGRTPDAGRGRWLWPALEGVLLGLAVGQKIWFAVPAVVILCFAGRRILPVAGGLVVAGCVVYLPFFLHDPAAMWREVVLDQTGRPASSPGRLLFQLAVVLGAPMHDEGGGSEGRTSDLVTVALAVVVLAALVVAATRRGARLYVVLFAACLLTLLASPSLFWHYASLTAVPEALVLGVALGAVAGKRLRRAVAPLLVVGTAATLLGLLVVDAWTSVVPLGAGHRVALTALRSAVREVDGCIMADDPTPLILANRVTSQLEAGCALWPDTTGWTYDRDRLRLDGKDVPRVRNPLWQARALRYLSSGSGVLLSRQSTRLDAHGRAALTAGRKLFDRDGVELYRTR